MTIKHFIVTVTWDFKTASCDYSLFLLNRKIHFVFRTYLEAQFRNKDNPVSTNYMLVSIGVLLNYKKTSKYIYIYIQFLHAKKYKSLKRVINTKLPPNAYRFPL
jgi:hypothetical protein